ncbi:MAG: hypothetical protein IT460_18350 [Planctomycetes bacterium]|nr:hypothetical protein [Planctomycetota bacterium]
MRLNFGSIRLIQSIAAAALLVGTAGLVFAGPNKQGCNTRLIVYSTTPETYGLECTNVSCGHACAPVTLTDGDYVCSCDGTSTNPSSYYDSETSCVGTVHVSGSSQAIFCHRDACPNPCEPDNTTFQGGEYRGCRCPQGSAPLEM